VKDHPPILPCKKSHAMHAVCDGFKKPYSLRHLWVTEFFSVYCGFPVLADKL
jgi:hypothetical protein